MWVLLGGGLSCWASMVRKFHPSKQPVIRSRMKIVRRRGQETLRKWRSSEAKRRREEPTSSRVVRAAEAGERSERLSDWVVEWLRLGGEGLKNGGNLGGRWGARRWRRPPTLPSTASTSVTTYGASTISTSPTKPQTMVIKCSSLSLS